MQFGRVLLLTALVGLSGCCWNSWGPEPEFYANLSSDTVEGRLRDNFTAEDGRTRVELKADALGLVPLYYGLAETPNGPRIFLWERAHLSDEMPVPTISEYGQWASNYPAHWQIRRADRLEFIDKGIWLDCPPSGYSYARDVNRYLFTFRDDGTLEQARVEGFWPESYGEHFEPIVVDF